MRLASELHIERVAWCRSGAMTGSAIHAVNCILLNDNVILGELGRT